jgi:hypothetical protein
LLLNVLKFHAFSVINYDDPCLHAKMGGERAQSKRDMSSCYAVVPLVSARSRRVDAKAMTVQVSNNWKQLRIDHANPTLTGKQRTYCHQQSTVHAKTNRNQ